MLHHGMVDEHNPFFVFKSHFVLLGDTRPLDE